MIMRRWGMLLVLIVLTVGAPLSCLGQNENMKDEDQELSDSRQIRAMNLAVTALSGRVLDEARQPLVGLRLEMELAPLPELRNEISASHEQLEEVLQQLLGSVGRGVFAVVETGKNGEYRIKGVPVPSIFYLIIRNAANYFPTRVKVSLESSVGKEFPVPDLFVRARPAPVKTLSEKARQAIDRSRQALARNDKKTALEQLRRAVELEPEYAEGHYNLAVLYLGEKKRDEALESLESCLRSDVAYRPAYRLRGEFRYADKDYSGALADFASFLSLTGKDGGQGTDEERVFFLAGNAGKALKRTEAAVGYFEAYLALKEKNGSLDVGDALILNDLGGHYYGRKDLNKAVFFYAKAVKTDPAVGAETYMYLGNCHLARREGDLAIPCYRTYLERAPNGPGAPQVKAILEKLLAMFPASAK
jgi:tetratricopeptide (TPR) repeat protein